MCSSDLLPQPGFAVYAASKAFVLSYVRALRAESREKQLRVTAVCPGAVKTEFFNRALTKKHLPAYKKLVMADPKKVVKKAVIPSVEVSSMEKVIAAAEADENIYAMIGIYPSEAKTYTQEVEDRMIELAKNHKVKAVGEIGLDYYWDKSFVDLQKEVYVKQILLANKLNLPIVIHDREAHKDAYDLLLEDRKSTV